MRQILQHVTMMIFVVLLASSCKSPQLESDHFKAFPEIEYPVIATPAEVTIHHDKVNFDYVEIGIAEARNGTREILEEKLKVEVSQMGGNALIDVTLRRQRIRGTVVIRK